MTVYPVHPLLITGESSKIVQPPDTPRRPVTNEYHGVAVVDDYQWLEDFSNPEVRKWNEEQNRYSRAVLDRFRSRVAIQSRVRELYTSTSADYLTLEYRPGILFALKSQPPIQQPFLVALSSSNLDSEKILVDPNKTDSKGTTTIDFQVPSLDGKLVAVSMSEAGSEEGTVHVYELDTGKKLPDVIPRVHYPTGLGSIAWNASASGFYYTRYPRGDERPAEDLNFYQQVYFHRIGTSSDVDRYVVGDGFPRIAEIKLSTSRDGLYLLATVANGDGGEFAHYVMDQSGTWTQATQFSDQATKASLGPDGYVYLLSHKEAPRGKIIRLDLKNPQLSHAEVVVEESNVSIDTFEPSSGFLYVIAVDGGPSEIRVFDHRGALRDKVSVEPVSSVSQLVRLDEDEILFRSESYITPPAWWLYSPETGQATRTRLVVTSPADYGDCEVVREFVISKDGTRIPLNIIRRKGIKLNRQNATLLAGYGGYGISVKPAFRIRRRVWLDMGGVNAVANLRGGGEYGEEWHKSGKLTKKQNVFDDFIACANYLIGSGYTETDKLAIEGGSNGGLLVGAALTQHPELFKAVVAHVGIFDMLRAELDPNGAFNVTEFGTVKDPEQFVSLYAYSPYHRVLSSKKYPAVMLMTGENDNRVNPSNSRKMVAKLQASTSSNQPILLRTSTTTGHGLGTALDELIAEDTDVFAFLFEKAGVDYKPMTL